MGVSKDDVREAARLCRIALPDERVDALAGELSDILDWIEQLSEVDIENVEPMTSVVDTRLPRRTDEVTDGSRANDILANAPQRADGFFVVPKTVE
jgi:aspartyl-tRNA(Asn)/glutamyl-tRNA(Gln) amidotransferase subunit C